MRLPDRLAVAIKPRRKLAELRSHLPVRDGASVVIVNWESLGYLRTTVAAVRRFSPDARIVVVDNGSTDGSVAWLRSQVGIQTIALPRNLGHGPALDVGFLAVRTRYAVALDVDAFPISDRWLDELVAMLGRARVAGAHGGEVLDRLSIDDVPEVWQGRDFVHPCCLAMEWRRFVSERHTFVKGGLGVDGGQQISERERPHLAYLEPTSTVGPGALGTVFGDLVYHNFYGTRHGKEGTTTVDGVSAEMSRAVWAASVNRYLGDA